MSSIRASVVGVTGYAGAELLRCLLQHPFVTIAHLVSRQHDHTPLREVFPRLSHIDGLEVDNSDYDAVARNSDAVFLCLPYGAAQDAVTAFLGKTRLVDLSADFRLASAQAYERYYHAPHRHPDLLGGRFVYGLPEVNREAIKRADAVANPGCYALLMQLLLLPFAGKIKQVDALAISGTSGMGRGLRDPADDPVNARNIRSYMTNEHRHIPEILATAKLTEEKFNFSPTVGPYLRGIFAQCFIETCMDTDLSVFHGHPFTRLTDRVELANVAGTNYADLSFRKGHGGRIMAQGALDNLLRGAAGTAVQNMNLMFGIDETAGLRFDNPLHL